MRLPSLILDPMIRRKAALSRIPLDRFEVRVARSVEEHEAAFRLVHAAYTFMGIEPVRNDAVRILPQHLLGESTTFIAYEGETLIGTLTVVQDSSAKLPLDKQYPRELASLRARGATLVEYASLAVVQRCWSAGVNQLLALAAYNYAFNTLGASHTVVGVHPRAGDYYRAVFNFRRLGPAQDHSELHAPVVGLVQDMTLVRPWFRRRYPRPMATGRTPYWHFTEDPPPCVQLPPKDLSLEALRRWKLPRHVFQELFLRRYKRVEELDQVTLDCLRTERSRDTLMPGAARVKAASTTALILEPDEGDGRRPRARAGEVDPEGRRESSWAVRS